MTNLSSLETLRPCGRIETYSTARHELEFYKNVSCAAEYTSLSSAIDLQTLIFRALHTVIARHSMLSAIPLNEAGSHPDVYFARLPAIDLRTCVKFVERQDTSQDEVEAVLQQQHNRNFKGNTATTPFWRFVVLQDSGATTKFTAIWVFHHALADGTSALVFHRTLLSALERSCIETSEPVGPLVKSPNRPLLPSLEDMHALPISTLFLFKALLGSIFSSWFNAWPAKLWTGGAISAHVANLRSKLKILTLSSARANRLLELSRKNKTTMTATLQCIIASAILKNLDTEQYERIKASGPISLRRFMRYDGGNIDDEFVNGMTQYEYVHARSPGSPATSNFSWDEARAVRAAIQTELNKEGNNSTIGLLRYVPDMHKFFTEKVGQDREHSLEISNLGVYRPDTDQGHKDGKAEAEGWKIEKCVFSQSPGVVGAAIAASVVTGGDGCAVIAFTWMEGIVDDDLIRKVMEVVDEEVEALIA